MISRPIHILNLFAGNHTWLKDFKKCGDIVRTVELNPKLWADINDDILNINADQLRALFPYGTIDVIIASPPCTTFSIASCSTHWNREEKESGEIVYNPKSKNSINGVKIIKHLVNLIEEIKPEFWWIENPRGLLRKVNLTLGS